MRRVVVIAVLAAAFATPGTASATCETHVHAGGVTVLGTYRHDGVTLAYCDGTPSSCPGVVFTPAVNVPGVVWLDPVVVNNCPL